MRTWTVDGAAGKFLVPVFWCHCLPPCMSFSTFSRWIFVESFGWSRWLTWKLTGPANRVLRKVTRSTRWTAIRSAWSTCDALRSLIPKAARSGLPTHHRGPAALPSIITSARHSLALANSRPIPQISWSHFGFNLKIILFWINYIIFFSKVNEKSKELMIKLYDKNKNWI